MMQVIDQAYLRALVALPDGFERLERWIGALIEERDTAHLIAVMAAREWCPQKGAS